MFDQTDWSRSKLAGAASIQTQTLSQMLDGIRHMQYRSLEPVCKVLRVHPAYILNGVLPVYLAEGEEMPRNPRELQDGAALSRPAQQLGVDRWLAKQPAAPSDGPAHSVVTPDERAWLRTIPWPRPHVLYPNVFYETLLLMYRQMQRFTPPDGDV